MLMKGVIIPAPSPPPVFHAIQSHSHNAINATTASADRGGEHDGVSNLTSLLSQAGTSWVTAAWVRIVSVEADVLGSLNSTPPRSSAA